MSAGVRQSSRLGVSCISKNTGHSHTNEALTSIAGTVGGSHGEYSLKIRTHKVSLRSPADILSTNGRGFQHLQG
jgi:hypothetical protein